jgi:hypothetical protein
MSANRSSAFTGTVRPPKLSSRRTNLVPRDHPVWFAFEPVAELDLLAFLVRA